MLTICGFISTFLGCNYTSLPLPYTQAAQLIFKWWQCILNMKREQYVIITECFFLTFTLWLMHFMFTNLMWCIWLYLLWFTNQLYHIICTYTYPFHVHKTLRLQSTDLEEGWYVSSSWSLEGGHWQGWLYHVFIWKELDLVERILLKKHWCNLKIVKN